MQTAIFPSKQTLTVKRIFEDNDNWEQFCLNRKDILRNVEVEEVNKMLSSKNKSRGYFTYQCECCGEFKFSENIGDLMENTVAVELLRQISNSNSRLEMYYWKDSQHREVDFVIKEGADVSQLRQVCYDIDNPKTKERELRSLVGAAKELNCSDLLVITWDHEDVEEFKGNNIRFMPLWKWLQEGDLQY